MIDFKKLNRENIRAYVKVLKRQGLSFEEIERKLESIRLFLEWRKSLGENVAEAIEEVRNQESKARSQKTRARRQESEVKSFSKTTDIQSEISKILNTNSLFRYIGFSLILIFAAFLGAGIYNRFFKKPERGVAYPLQPVRAGRIISFQGRLTDSLGNPITTKTDMVFKLYNVPTGGTPLYTGSCTGVNGITPDQDGIFEVLIGQDCGMSEIPANIFTENANVYLGVTVGSDAEMTPRQQIANVGYAMNAETLQGLPPDTGENATAFIPFVNQGGDILLALPSPAMRSTFSSANFELSSANTITITSAGTGDVILQATESGQLKLRTGGSTDTYTRLVVDELGNVGIGTLSPSYKLDVAGTGRFTSTLYADGGISTTTGGLTLDSFSGTTTINDNLTITGSTIDTALPTGVVHSDSSGVLSSVLGTANYIPKWTSTGLSTTSNIYDDGTNVGIGTTIPTAKLHVVGECIVEGSLVPVRRRKRKREDDEGEGEGDEPKDSSKFKVQSDDEFEYFEMPIEEIRPGDEVLSLDETTGEFVWRKVEKTMDKGWQPVYRLVTQSGLLLEATANHPFLVASTLPQSAPSRSSVFAVDQSGRVEETEKDTVVSVANKEKASAVLLPAKVKRKLQQVYKEIGRPKKFGPETFAYLVVEAIKRIDSPVSHLTLDIEYPGHEKLIIETIKRFYPAISFSVRSIGKNNVAHKVALAFYRHKKSEAVASLSLVGDLAAERLHQEWVPGFATPTASAVNKVYQKRLSLSRIRTEWIKMAYLKPGMVIATARGWEKISAIFPIGRKHVYDLQIEDTRNFVAQGIVAHNTFISDKLGVGNQPVGKLHVEGAVTGKALAIFNETGDQDILVASASGQTKFVVSNSGNVGIGTVSPGYKLEVAGTGKFSGDLTLASVSSLADNNKVLTVDTSGVVKYINTSSWDKNAGDDVTTFLGLSDTPSSYSGFGGYFVKVKPDESGLEFASTSSISPWTEGSDVIYPYTLTNNVSIGTSSKVGKLGIVGDTDEVQLYVKGFSTQTNNLVEVRKSDNTLLLSLNNNGNLNIFGNITASTTDTINGLSISSASITDAVNITMSGTLDLGTNTIYDGNFTGNWNFNNGNLSGINDLTVSGTLTANGTIDTALSTGVVHSDSSGVLSSVLGTANYIPKWTSTGLSTTSNIYDNGTNVGIGTTGPGEKLDLYQGVFRIWNGSGYAPIRFYSSGDGTHNNANINIWSFGSGGGESLYHDITNWGGNFYWRFGSGLGMWNAMRLSSSPGGGSTSKGAGLLSLYNNDVETIRIAGNGNTFFNSGNVGIGTVSPNAKLDIENGNIEINNGYGIGTPGYPATLALSNDRVGIGTTNPSSFKLQVAGSVGPDATNTYDLGSSTLQWRNIYGQTIYQNGQQVISDIVAGNGLTSSQTGGQITLNVGAGTCISVGVDTVGVAGDCLDFAQFQDTLDLDATTTINLGGYNFNINLNSTGDFVIQDAGTSIHTFYDNGNIEFDMANDTLFIDSVNNRVGIGTTSPETKLDVAGSAYIDGLRLDGTIAATTFADPDNNYALVFNAGNGGLIHAAGSTAPFKLHLQDGHGRVSYLWNVEESGGSYNYAVSSEGANWFLTNNGEFTFYTAPAGTAGNAISWNTGLHIDSSGNVGIGTTGPGEKLDLYQGVFRIWNGSGYAPIRFYSSGDGTHNNANINIWSFGSGGGESLYHDITNWGGNFYWRFGSGLGMWNAMRLSSSPGGGSTSKGAGLLSLYNNDVETIRIAGNGNTFFNSGNVGIGTVSPNAKLDIENGNIEINNGYGIGTPGYPATLALSNDRVGIGTTNPNQYHLEVAGGIMFNKLNQFGPDPYQSWGAFRKVRLTSSPYIEIQAGNGNLYGIDIWLSSRRFKQNITDLEIDSSKIYQLRPVSFNWNWDREGKNRTFGLIAEEVAEVLPQLVNFDENGIPHHVNYELLSVLNTAELQKIRKGLLVDQFGNIGIGTDNPESYKLYVNGTAFSTGGWQSSDIRLKNKTENLSNVLDKIANLETFKFTWKRDQFPHKGLPKGVHIGISAQQVQQVFPELINFDNEGYLAVDYAGLTVVNLSAIKELNEKVKDLNKTLSLNSSGDIKIENSSQEYVYDGNLDIESQISNLKSQIYNLKLKTGEIIDRIGSFAELVAGKIKSGLIEAENIIVNNTLLAKNIVAENINLTTENLTIAGKKLSDYIDERIQNILNTKYLILDTERVVSPVDEESIKYQVYSIKNKVDELEKEVANIKDQISSDESMIAQKTDAVDTLQIKASDSGKLAKLIIEKYDGTKSIILDSEGNASISGELKAYIAKIKEFEAKTATIEGTLVAKEVQAENVAKIEEEVRSQESEVRDLKDQVEEIKRKLEEVSSIKDQVSSDEGIIAQKTDAVDTLAELSNEINKTQQLLAQIPNEPLPDPTYYQNLSFDSTASVDQKTDAVENKTSEILTTTYSPIYEPFNFGTIAIVHDSILSLSWELKLSALEKVSFFDDKVVIAKDGTITTEGQVIAKEGVKTNKIENLDGKDITIKLNDQLPMTNDQTNSNDQNSNEISLKIPKLKFENSLGNEVASIDASGSVYFRELKVDKYLDATDSAVIVARENQISSDSAGLPAIKTEGQIAGIGRIPAGEQEIIIYNERAKTTSVILTTPTTPDFEGSLVITEKADGYFKVKTTKRFYKDIVFDWLIIN